MQANITLTTIIIFKDSHITLLFPISFLFSDETENGKLMRVSHPSLFWSLYLTSTIILINDPSISFQCSLCSAKAVISQRCRNAVEGLLEMIPLRQPLICPYLCFSFLIRLKHPQSISDRRHCWLTRSHWGRSISAAIYVVMLHKLVC